MNARRAEDRRRPTTLAGLLLAGLLPGGASCSPEPVDISEPADLDWGVELASLGHALPGPAALREEDREEELARLREELAQCRQTLEAQRAELELLEAKRLARESEWLGYTRAIAALDPKSLPDSIHFEALGPEENADSEANAAEPENAAAERSREVLRTLRTLLILEGVRGLDLLEIGLVDDDRCGPVVFRLLDDGGRLSGTLCAERLRLEGSRAGRTLTIVLEDGFEAHRGVRTPFAGSDAASSLRGETVHGGGVRRIHLPSVDPMPWVESLPELFGEFDHETELDDGAWNLPLLRHTLNRLLREDAAAGYYRVESLRGVSKGILREVHLEHRDAEGTPDRRLFADRLTILAVDRGVQLLLEEGVHVRGEHKAPFLDGRYRIFLPRAGVEHWRAEGVPGLSPPPASSGPGTSKEERVPGEGTHDEDEPRDSAVPGSESP